MSFKSSNTKTYPELEYKYDMYITYNTKYEKFTDTSGFLQLFRCLPPNKINK